jgi:hemoglobin
MFMTTPTTPLHPALRLASGLLLVLVLAVPAVAGEKPQPTVAEQMTGLQAMCTESADARAARHEANPLWHRLGGRDKVRALVDDVIARHRVNEPIKHFMDGVDDEKLAAHLVDFISAGTGGGGKYTGRSLPDAHRSMKLTDADFLAAGGDIIAAMQAMEYGQEEIDEFVCILVSLKGGVVFE